MELREGYKNTEVGVIPEDWDVKPLLECCSKITDGTHDTPKPVETGIPFLTAIHVKENNIDYQSCYYLPESVHRIIFNRCNPEKNDVLMVNIGAGVATTALVNVDYEFSLKNVALLKPELSKLVGAFLNYWQIYSKSRIISSISTGGAQPFLSLNQIGNLKIAMPTKAEQTAIATALSDADALINSLEKLIAKKRNIKQGAMQQLLKPKEGWEVKKLGEIAEVRDGTHQTPSYVESGIPFYSVESVTNNDFKNTKYITEEAHKLLTKTFKIEKGDILMTRIGSIGDCKLVDWDVNASFYVSLALLKIKPNYSAEYIYHYSKTANFKKEADINSLQSAIPKKINLGPISNIKIEMPEYDEQIRIASILSDMDNEIQALETKLEKYRKIKLGMMQNLLTGKIRLV